MLIKHNLLDYHFNQVDHLAVYKVDNLECMMRLSYPRFLAYVEREFSAQHCQIICFIIEHGSLSKK